MSSTLKGSFMVLAMLYFSVSIVEHFTGMNQAQKEEEADRRDSLFQAQIEHLTSDNTVLKEAIRSQQLHIDGLEMNVGNINYKVNRMMNQ